MPFKKKVKDERRNGSNAGPEARTLPIKEFTMGGIAVILLGACLMLVLAAVFDYDVKMGATGLDISSNVESYQPAAAGSTKTVMAPGGFTAEEKKIIMRLVELGVAWMEQLAQRGITVNDIIKHTTNYDNHLFNPETGKRSPIIKELQDNLSKKEDKK